VFLVDKKLPVAAHTITVSGRMNHHSLQFIIDTGASSTVVNRTVAEKLKLHTRYEGLRIVTAIDGATPNVSMTDRVRIEVHGSVVFLPQIVHDLPREYDCLLGLDWLAQAKAMVDTGENRLIFKPREVCLFDGNETAPTDTVQCLLSELELTEHNTEEELIDAEQTWDDNIIIDVKTLTHLDHESGDRVREFLQTHLNMFANSYNSLGVAQ
jgi:predicted aspartyl protease